MVYMYHRTAVHVQQPGPHPLLAVYDVPPPVPDFGCDDPGGPWYRYRVQGSSTILRLANKHLKYENQDEVVSLA